VVLDRTEVDTVQPGKPEVGSMTKDDIFKKVAATLVEALNVDEDQVSLSSTLQGDLGAESIDFLDIVFRLEREFSIKIPRNELFPESIFQGDPDLVKDGKVTAKGIAELRDKMPYANLTEFEKNPTLEGISDLFTVDLIVSYIESKLKKMAHAA
jgi:acyl carrier protein